MLIKNFQGASMQEALKKVKAEYGENAMILSTRVVDSDSRLNPKGAKLFEITASKDAPPGRHAPMQPPQPSTSNLTSAEKRLVTDVGVLLRRFESDLNRLAENQTEILAQLRTPANAQPVLLYLEAQDLDRGLIAKLFENADSEVTTELLRSRLCTTCAKPQPLKILAAGTNRVAVVGPPGVGKSSLIAKLATRLVLQQKVKVTMVTLDDYKPSAGRDLEVYAKHLEVPFMTSAQWKQTEPGREPEVVLIDTAGASVGSANDLKELTQRLAQALPNEIHLVLPAHTRWQEARRWLEFYRVLGVTQIAVTFMDQAESHALPFNLAGAAGAHLSYFSWGRSQAANLEEVDLPALAARLFERYAEATC